MEELGYYLFNFEIQMLTETYKQKFKNGSCFR